MTARPSQKKETATEQARLRIVVRGAVQGVGFRPFVHRQATALSLSGWVHNSSEGVAMEAEGGADDLATFVAAIRTSPPTNAMVAAIDIQRIEPRGETVFTIRASETAGTRVAQPLPDLATCPDCLAELFDPADRRYRYPFINCTQCGPRFSIIEDMPYDRVRTSMRHFPMCRACRAEYEDPATRRFHAEPNACPDCGPRLALWDPRGRTLARDHDALLAAAVALREGAIVALKGIGGFHLLADARDEVTVRRLRARKRRPDKPFAVMFPSLAEVSKNCQVGPVEAALLTGPARPIVLLRRTRAPMAEAVAPGNPWLGALLPYAPVHHLLMQELGFPVVATSGNTTDEPIVTDETEAIKRLAAIADLFLVHDRPIVRPLDDSVVRVGCGRELMLRLARGYAPASIAAEGTPSGILAFGGHLKTTVALTIAGNAVLSQHIGDLDTTLAREAHTSAVADATELHRLSPRLAVCDLHPDYASSRAAETSSLPLMAVQHHVAHIAACMAEHGIEPPALGVAWDGTGYGPDGTIWGGEFLQISEAGWRRVAHLRPFRLPGGDAAVREPRRAALGLLYEAFGGHAFAMADLAPVAAFPSTVCASLRTMLAHGTNAPLTSSAGRLFDAFAALCGLRQRASYEGQAAAELEWAAGERATRRRYEFSVRPAKQGEAPLIVDWQPALESALADLRAGVSIGAISEAFHNGLGFAITEVAARMDERRVVLSGGCFQNARLTEVAAASLRAGGFDPIWHRHIPPNDGGIALGQAVWAAWCERRDETMRAEPLPDQMPSTCRSAEGINRRIGGTHHVSGDSRTRREHFGSRVDHESRAG
jgi:hydrogenase maturation protein HypF